MDMDRVEHNNPMGGLMGTRLVGVSGPLVPAPAVAAAPRRPQNSVPEKGLSREEKNVASVTPSSKYGRRLIIEGCYASQGTHNYCKTS